MVELTLIIGVSSLLPLNESAFFLLFIYFFQNLCFVLTQIWFCLCRVENESVTSNCGGLNYGNV